MRRGVEEKFIPVKGEEETVVNEEFNISSRLDILEKIFKVS